MSRRVAFISVVPSPYQRDLFHALSQRHDIDPQIYYMEAAAPDSPWPEKPLAPYEQIMPGGWAPLGSARVHYSWPLPDLRDFDFVVMNTLMSVTGQWLMRGPLHEQKWCFWGERLGPRKSRWHDALTAPLARANGIAAIGKLAVENYRARFPDLRIFNIPYHCELAGFIEQARPANPEPVFLFCGQMIARKGLDLLLEAFRRLGAGRLLLVGREAELPAMLVALPAETQRRIEYAGFQPPEELPRFFARADVFVLSSRHDGWGVVVNQALGAGLPLVCSDAVGSAHDLIEPEINGVMFPSGEIEALEKCLRRFVADPSLATRWGAASRAKAADWTPECGAEKWAHAIEELCGA